MTSAQKRVWANITTADASNVVRKWKAGLVWFMVVALSIGSIGRRNPVVAPVQQSGDQDSRKSPGSFWSGFVATICEHLWGLSANQRNPGEPAFLPHVAPLNSFR
jgi:hypothetical protein